MTDCTDCFDGWVAELSPHMIFNAWGIIALINLVVTDSLFWRKFPYGFRKTYELNGVIYWDYSAEFTTLDLGYLWMLTVAQVLYLPVFIFWLMLKILKDYEFLKYSLVVSSLISQYGPRFFFWLTGAFLVLGYTEEEEPDSQDRTFIGIYFLLALTTTYLQWSLFMPLVWWL